MPQTDSDNSVSSDPSDVESTRWSLVLDAAHRSVPGSDEALETLCGIYWFPLYAYARRRVRDSNEALDLTQEFFSKLLEKNYLAEADPTRGRFRGFLFTVFKHFLSNEWSKTRAQKRGGGKTVVSMDVAAAEARINLEAVDDETPQKRFDREWAETLVNYVLELVGQGYSERGESATFERLRQFVSSSRERDSYANVAKSLAIEVGAVRVAVHRLRQRFRQKLRQEIAETVQDPQEVDDEIRSLLEIMSS